MVDIGNMMKMSNMRDSNKKIRERKDFQVKGQNFSPTLREKQVEKFYDDRVPDEELQPILDTVVEDWRELNEDEREEFRHQIQSFIRLYGYISQIISFKDLKLEKLYIFLRCLNKKLPKREIESISDVLSSVDLEYFRIEKKFTAKIDLQDGDGELSPITSDAGTVTEEPEEFLSEIIKTLNDSFGTDLTEDDRINLEKIHQRIVENKELRKVYFGDNTESNRKHTFKKIFDEVLLGLVEDNIEFYNKLKEPRRNEFMRDRFYEKYPQSVESI